MRVFTNKRRLATVYFTLHTKRIKSAVERLKGRSIFMKMAHRDCQLHPSFQSKSVYELRCRYCDQTVCVRGMKAILLADRNVELFSTDQPPAEAVKPVGKEYETSNCFCRITNVACSLCGQGVGYHVTLPCQSCLASCNNGHFWMYHSRSVRSEERLNSSGDNVLVWGEVPPYGEDTDILHNNVSGLKWIECCR